MKNVIKMMSPRMLMIAKSVGQCTKVFDTGSDHAFIPIYLLQNGICKEAVASDVRQGPVDVAEKNIRKFMPDGKITLSLCDGIANATGSDCIIAAGMGGQLITDILKREPQISQNAEQLILQPMNAPEKLREYLWNNGYTIYYENLCSEKHKVYNVICTRYTGNNRDYEIAETHSSEFLVRTGHPLLTNYLKPKLKRLSDMVKGGNDPDNINSKLIKELEALVK